MPLPSRNLLHSVGQKPCPNQGLQAGIDRSPSPPLPVSYRVFSRNQSPIHGWEPQAQAPPSPAPAAPSYSCDHHRDQLLLSHTEPSSQVGRSYTPPLSANWTTFSRDEGACPHQEPTTQLQWSPTPPFLPKGYTMYSMDRGSTSSNRAVYSLDRTMLSQLDPSIEPGQVSSSVPVNCAVYSMKSSSPSPDLLAEAGHSSPLFPPLMLAIYSKGPGNFPTHLELPSQIDRSYTPPVPASCTIYNQDLLLPPHQVG